MHLTVQEKNSYFPLREESREQGTTLGFELVLRVVNAGEVNIN